VIAVCNKLISDMKVKTISSTIHLSTMTKYAEQFVPVIDECCLMNLDIEIRLSYAYVEVIH
jgi:hypothetical protein